MSRRSRKIADRLRDTGFRPNSRIIPFPYLNRLIPIAERPAEFTESLRRFSELEFKREAVDAETVDSLKISDPPAFREWLRGAGNLRSISDSLCANLGRWLPMFRSAEGGGSQGTNMLEGLVRLEERLASLDPSAHRPEMSRKLVAMGDDELQSAADLSASVLLPAPGLAKINPMRWLRKRRLRTLLTSIDLAQDDPAISSFHRAAELELDLRPLRAQLEEYLHLPLRSGPGSQPRARKACRVLQESPFDPNRRPYPHNRHRQVSQQG